MASSCDCLLSLFFPPPRSCRTHLVAPTTQLLFYINHHQLQSFASTSATNRPKCLDDHQQHIDSGGVSAGLSWRLHDRVDLSRSTSGGYKRPLENLIQQHHNQNNHWIVGHSQFVHGEFVCLKTTSLRTTTTREIDKVRVTKKLWVQSLKTSLASWCLLGRMGTPHAEPAVLKNVAHRGSCFVCLLACCSGDV